MDTPIQQTPSNSNILEFYCYSIFKQIFNYVDSNLYVILFI